ncbi:hypothetical protein ATCC90586_008638 [Pythium insidiosum]|nr:hypothetical protein ATCC90586_008638 [Pythium insidiosum]
MNDPDDDAVAVVSVDESVEREEHHDTTGFPMASASQSSPLKTRPSFSASNNEVLEAPTPNIAAYEPFVRWLLQSPLEELTSLHSTPPFEVLTPAPRRRSSAGNNQLDSPVARRSRFLTKAQAAFARAAAEAEWEEIADQLSMARRERDGIEETLWDLQHEREENRERIALLESRIAKHLQDRDLAIAETYTTEKQITDLVHSKTHTNGSGAAGGGGGGGGGGSILPSFLRFHDKRSASQASMFSTKDIEKLQKEVADTKLETALAKTELDTRYYRLRSLEKQVVGLKLEIAQASALEDDLQASLAQLQRERRTSLDKLQQVSSYSAPLASETPTASPVKLKSPKRK